MFRASLQHSGSYRGEGTARFGDIKWKFHTNGQVISSPAVANNTVYVGSNDHYLYALDLATGTQKWKFKAGSRVTSSPAVFNGNVYFGSYDGYYYAVNSKTGRVKWKFHTGGEHRFEAKHIHGAQPVSELMPDPFDFYLSSPAVWNGSVYFGSSDGNIYALDANTGNLRWKFQTGDVVHASPAISEGMLFIGSWDSYFYALNAVTGKEKWRFKTGEDPEIHNQVGIASSAVVADETVFFGCRDSNLYALDALTGAKKWAFNNKGSWVISSPAYWNGRVYFATSDSGLFYVLDAKEGNPVFSLDFKHWPMFSSPAIAGNMAYIGSHEGKLIAIDLSTQATAWSLQTDGSRHNGSRYTKPDGSANYEAAFADDFYDDIVAGVQRMMSVGAILSSPIVVDDMVIVGSMDGNVYGIGTSPARGSKP